MVRPLGIGSAWRPWGSAAFALGPAIQGVVRIIRSVTQLYSLLLHAEQPIA